MHTPQLKGGVMTFTQTQEQLISLMAQSYVPGQTGFCEEGLYGSYLRETSARVASFGAPIARIDTQTARLDEIEAKIDQILAILSA